MKAQGRKGFLFQKIRLQNRKIYKQVDLDSYFGEGITFLNDKLYQNMARKNSFIYNATSLKLENLRLY
jgi:glutamine cyclotransferase